MASFASAMMRPRRALFTSLPLQVREHGDHAGGEADVHRLLHAGDGAEPGGRGEAILIGEERAPRFRHRQDTAHFVDGGEVGRLVVELR
jgi:hypothetical protein